MKYCITIELGSVNKSAARQQEIRDESVRKKGEESPKKYIVVLRYTEHHTGFVVGICLIINGTVVDDNDCTFPQKEIFEKIPLKIRRLWFKDTHYNIHMWFFLFFEFFFQVKN